MFVASRVYNYATGSSSVASTSKAEVTPANSRVKRHPKKVPNQSPAPPSYASVAAEALPSTKTNISDEERKAARSAADLAKIAVIDEIVLKEDLYEVLGVKKNAKNEDIRRGFLNRSRICHPDKMPNYAPCVVAFQKVSFAYQTLSKPSSRKMYDVSGRTDYAAAVSQNSSSNGFDPNGLGSDETLNGVLYSVFLEFLEGDFEMIRVLINALNEGNPGLDLGDDAVNNIEGAFRKLRELLLAGKKYLTIIRFELIRLYEIQHSLRQLSYFDVFGRLRLTLQLARVTLSIPMAIDQAMKEDEGGKSSETSSGVDAGDIGAASDDDEVGEDENDTDEDAEHNISRKQRRRQSSVEEEFGMRAEDEEEEKEEAEESFFDREPQMDQERSNRHKSKSARRKARIQAHRKAKLEAKEADALQRKGLLGPTASGLLLGVVKVLETGERWVPGGSKDQKDETKAQPV